MVRKKLRHAADNRTIDPQDDYQLAYWTNQIGVSREKLLAAVQAGGTSADDVKKRLKKKHFTGSK